MANLEARTESLSGADFGELTEINGTAWNTPTILHNITVSGVVDSIFLHVWNTYWATVDVNLILNPDDSSTMASVDDATVTLSIGPLRDVWILQGDRFRRHGSGNNTATIAAYVAGGDINRIKFTGHVVRYTQPIEVL